MKRKIMTLLLLVLMCSLSIAAAKANAEDGATLKLLTLNLLFSEPTTSLSSDNIPRFNSIADFIVDNDIDCVLCQEVVGGTLAKKLGLTQTLNSSLDLKSLLGNQYNLTYRLANGIPLLFSVGNAVFCKKSIDIKWTLSQTLSFASEININGIDIKLRRIIMGSLLEVPGFGKLLLFNTHLCSFCPSEQRQVQIEEALEFIEKVRKLVRWIYGKVPVVFAGDFNIHDNLDYEDSAGAEAEYNLITDGFVDAYAAYGNNGGCEFGIDCCIPVDNPSDVEPGCTYAVDDNPFEFDPNQTTRIDYFFLKGVEAVSAYVVFDGKDTNGPFVSDHSGVVVELPY